MALKVLKQVEYDAKEEKEIESIILHYLYYTLFYPIIEANHIPKKTILNNAKNTSIEEALKRGDITYEDGKFKGKFSASLSKKLRDLGAKFNSKSKTFSIKKELLPSAIRIAILQEDYKRQEAGRRTLEAINKIDTNNIEKITFTPEYDSIINEMDIKIHDNVKDFAVSPELSKRAKEQIAQAYSENLKLYVKNFADEEILKLREEVQKNVYAGFRREKLIELMQERYGVSKNKAKFLAKQETSLLMASFTKERYEDAGVKKFEWTRSHAKKPDHFHKQYYGKIFSFDDLPIIDEKTGQRGLPGERFGCLTGDTKMQSFVFAKKLYRRWYVGELTHIITYSGETLRITPNHPVLTSRGWIAAELINVGDNIIHISNKIISPSPCEPNDMASTFEEQFGFFQTLFSIERAAASKGDFHGDMVIDDDIDIINIKSFLCDNFKILPNQSFFQNIFTESNEFSARIQTACDSTFLQQFPFLRLASHGAVSMFSEAFSFLFGEERHSIEHGFASVSWLETVFDQIIDYCITRNDKMISKPQYTFPTIKQKYQFFFWEILFTWGNSMMPNEDMPSFSHLLGNNITTNVERLRNFAQIFSLDIKIDSVVNTFSTSFTGHVYNLENTQTWYKAENIIVKNCSCGMRAVLEV